MSGILFFIFASCEPLTPVVTKFCVCGCVCVCVCGVCVGCVWGCVCVCFPFSEHIYLDFRYEASDFCHLGTSGLVLATSFH